MDSNKIRQQSESAYNQWKDDWRSHAKYNSKHKMKPLSDFENIGIGRKCLVIANGQTFEDNIETIKKYQDNVDIMVCDKTLGHCLDNGIIPTYCLVCDAHVNYDKYMEKWKDQLGQTTLFINACANPKWAENGNWKSKYFFVNKDILQSEKEFCALSGCKNVIPAGTNVSNAMVVFLTQSDNNGRRNFFGYDGYALIGFDYSWRVGGKYYAFDETGNGKTNYMRHVYSINLAGDPAYSSGNLVFSAEWLQTYVKTFKLPIVQCSQRTILGLRETSTLEKQMNYKSNVKDSKTIRSSVEELRQLNARAAELKRNIEAIGRRHHAEHLASL